LWNHPRPINSAVTRTCGDFWATAIPQIPEPARKIDHPRHRVLAFAIFQMIGKFLRAGVAHRDDSSPRVENFEEFSALGFLVHGDRRLSVAHDIGQPQPREVITGKIDPKKSGERARFSLIRKMPGSLASENILIGDLSSAVPSDKRVHDCAQPSRGRAVSFLTCSTVFGRSPTYQKLCCSQRR